MKGISFSKTEIRDITKAWLVVSLAFAIVLSPSILSIDLLVLFVITLFTAGLGFLLHELGHKVIAQKYGHWAEFRSFDNMLVFALVMSIFGFVFAAPGAVFIRGNFITRKENGHISIAGPAVNFVLALLFLILVYFGGSIATIGTYGFYINAWLGLFNLIPFGPFDGKKILNWSKVAYGLMIVVGFGLMIGYNFV